jgi:hypothetical protein
MEIGSSRVIDWLLEKLCSQISCNCKLCDRLIF